MVAALGTLITLGEIALRGAKVVKELRKNGSNSAADAIQKECDAACASIVGTVRRRRAASTRARAQRRSGGQFS